MPDYVVKDFIDDFLKSDSLSAAQATLNIPEQSSVLSATFDTKRKGFLSDETTPIDIGDVVKITDQGNRIEQYLGDGGDVVAGFVWNGVVFSPTNKLVNSKRIYAATGVTGRIDVFDPAYSFQWDGSQWSYYVAGVLTHTGASTTSYPWQTTFNGIAPVRNPHAGQMNWMVLRNTVFLSLSYRYYIGSKTIYVEGIASAIATPAGSWSQVGWVYEGARLVSSDVSYTSGYGGVASELLTQFICIDAATNAISQYSARVPPYPYLGTFSSIKFPPGADVFVGFGS